MKKDELILIATKAKIEINDQIEAFIESIERGTTNPDAFMSISQLEDLWKELNLGTHKTYSDMVSSALSSLDTPEVNESKKGSSSRME